MDPDPPFPELPPELPASLFWQAAEGMFVADSRGRVFVVNTRGCELLGYAPGEILGRPFTDFMVAEDLKATPVRLDELRAGKTVVSERRLRRKDGRQFPVEITTRMLPSGYLLGIGRDITDRRRTEQVLRESESRYRTLFEAANDAILLVEDARFVDCNARTLEIFGCSREWILGHHPADLSPPLQRGGSPSTAAAEAWMRKALAGEPMSFDWLHCRADGTPFDAEVSLSRVELGGKFFLQAIVRDLAERKAAERARLEMERRLLHAQKLESLGIPAGGVTHDFNNLLMAMLGNLELALPDLPPGSRARPRLEAVGSAARRAAELTGQMLAYSGRGRFMVARLDLNELVEECVRLLRASTPATLTLKLQLDCGIPAIEADAEQIRQVITNLATNASEAVGSEPGVITLSTGALDCDAAYLHRNRLDGTPMAGHYVYLEVADTGCGMDEQTQKQMFEPFFTTKFTGRGLGLAAVLGIVRGHRGTVLLDSAAGKGAVVRVLFPMTLGAQEEAGPEVGAPAGRDEPVPCPAGRGAILVVDDEEIVLKPCAALVESMGFAVLTAMDGEQAVEVVRRHGASIRAIILDLTMPNLDGAAALDQILRVQPGAKVILSSGYDQAEATRCIAKERLAGFIRKPFPLDELRSTLERVLGTTL